ncbi:Uu.00g108860.m01.CDS01 [Anthostomella pinea]|uniref:Uu.00g108860.m01.CDS01 n=1 Tax=Anthostomella pinea TaxID=933095 RepID=A0AAI8YG39_9PEZI|nr:Uu.00g108860.m01.CDS01 [Anthostomella pinea]
MSEHNAPVRVAIVGGGITGVILALGLQKRGIDYTIYERAPAFTEIGAGIGFSPNAERALKVVDPEVYAVYKEVASSNAEEDYFQWVDGHRSNEVVSKLLIGVDAFQGGRRSDFLEAWSELIPRDKVRFGRDVDTIFQHENGNVTLKFKDGSTEQADIVIGCDGIRSRVRQLILGEANPASYPRYTNKYCFRTLVPMPQAQAALGEERITNRYMYNGPNAHCMIYPVAMGALLNVLLVLSDPGHWPADARHTAPGDKQEAVRAFEDWHPHVRALVDLLPDELDKWAIFDMHDYPAPYYNVGSVAVAGDAAHASGPHLGSGAGFGIEDALVLASVIEAADREVRGATTKKKKKVEICRDALVAYNTVRYDRAQWLPGATREAVELFQWQDERVGSDPEKFAPEISRLFHTIWDNDIDEMVKGAVREFNTVLAGGPRAHL